jgi:hypothetical protein
MSQALKYWMFGVVSNAIILAERNVKPRYETFPKAPVAEGKIAKDLRLSCKKR